jgi:hypothetical protein
MRAKEFLAERQQVNEIVFIPPAIAALGAAIGQTVAWRAFMVAFNAYSVYELVKALVEIIEKNQYDVNKMDGFDWALAAVYIGFGTWSAKVGIRDAKQLFDMMPASAKQTFGNWVKTTFEGKVKEEIAKKAATTAAKPAASTAPKNPNLVDKPFSKDAPVPATPTPGASAFDRMATDLTKTKPKNPNLVDRPFSK